jgi:hypothetical protein
MNFKNFIKNSPAYPALIYLRYWLTRYLIERKFCNVKITNMLQLNRVSNGIHFFGYYNITPENSIGDVLFLKVKEERIRGCLTESADIMLKESDGSIYKLTETKAWNWQQGCMLQWYPGKNDQIIFNDYDAKNDKYIAKIIDTKGYLLETYNKPVNNVSKCGNYALSLNYSRLAVMRPDYGYFNRGNVALPEDNEDGIWHIDFNSGETNLIISLEQLKNLSWSDTMEGAMHKVNHIDINSSGTHFMFLHRWKGPKGRFMRLITANADGNELKILNGDVMTSHCCWLNNKDILSFCNYKGKVGYFKFDNQTEKVVYFSDQMPVVDGHPSISPNCKWIVCDTYPNKARFSSLFLYNIENNTLKKIGEFHQPLKYKKEIRVDLHPKWSVNNEAIYFESAHHECRKLNRISKFL